MRRIIWSPSALSDLKEAFEYIATDNLRRASRWVEEVFKTVEKLARFPNVGRVIPEIGKSRYRELIFGDYRLFHEVREKEVLIFRVLHSRRDG